MELNMETGYASQWQELLAQLAPDRRRAMEFLRDHLPLSDLDTYPLSYFLWRRIFLTTTFSSRG